MVDLDAPERFPDVDPEDALAAVEATPDQWDTAARRSVVRLDLTGATGIVVLGMGGSGIVGDIVAEVSHRSLPVPVVVAKGYELPAFVGPDTLVVAVSHSGGTEETCAAARKAAGRGSRLFGVCGDGDLAAIVSEAGGTVVDVAPGRQPRFSLGDLVVPVLIGLGLDAGLEEAVACMRALSRELGREVPVTDNEAKRVALLIANATATSVFGTEGLGAIAAYRLKCQLNENAKLAAAHGQLPEIDHNEIATWALRPPGARAGAVWFRDEVDEHAPLIHRYEATRALAGSWYAWQHEIVARGKTVVARLASLVFVADLVSVYAAIALDRDPSDIANIVRLKDDLAQRV